MNKVLFFNFMKKKFRGKFEKITNQFLTHLIKMILKIKTRKLLKIKWRVKKAFLILFVINLNKERVILIKYFVFTNN